MSLSHAISISTNSRPGIKHPLHTEHYIKKDIKREANVNVILFSLIFLVIIEEERINLDIDSCNKRKLSKIIREGENITWS